MKFNTIINYLFRVLAENGHNGKIPLPDISTKEKAQEYIGLDMKKEKELKKEFLDKKVPEWLTSAQEKDRLAQR